MGDNPEQFITVAKNFGDVSVDIAPTDLRALVEEVINRHLPQDQLSILKIAEESERELLTSWLGGPQR